MTRRRKYKRLMWWRRWMKETRRLQLRDHLYDHIANLSEVQNVRMETGGWGKSIIHITFKDGVTEIYESEFWVKDALKKAAFKLYIIQTQKILHP